jgi:hypothetical protein
MSNLQRARRASSVGRITLLAGAVIVICGLWYMATVPWAVSWSEVAPFIAPGALLGIGAGWISYATKPDRFTWQTGRNAAITGALLLPPLICVAFVIMGARPERVLSSIVRGSWIAFAGGALWGVGMWLVHRMERRTA